MPNEEDKTIVENGKKDDAAPAAEEKKKGGSNIMLFGGIGLGAIVVGVALALFVIKPMMSDSGAEGDETEQVEDSHGEKKKPKSDGHGSSQALIHEISNIVVNPAGTGGSRFLSASFGFELESPELEAEFNAREVVIRDALITILASKTVAQLTDPKQKEVELAAWRLCYSARCWCWLSWLQPCRSRLPRPNANLLTKLKPASH